MNIKTSLVALSLLLPLSLYAAGSGWTAETKTDMVKGCTDSIVENIVFMYKQQSGLSASDSLPAEIQDGLNTKIMPQVKETCSCTIDSVAEKHSYEEVANDISIMERAGAAIGTPEGCPLDI